MPAEKETFIYVKDNKDSNRKEITSFCYLEYWAAIMNELADFSYLEVLFPEDERRCELSSWFGEIHLNKSVSLLPRRLPEDPTGLPYNDKPLLKKKNKCKMIIIYIGCCLQIEAFSEIFHANIQPLTLSIKETQEHFRQTILWKTVMYTLCGVL